MANGGERPRRQRRIPTGNRARLQTNVLVSFWALIISFLLLNLTGSHQGGKKKMSCVRAARWNFWFCFLYSGFNSGLDTTEFGSIRPSLGTSCFVQLESRGRRIIFSFLQHQLATRFLAIMRSFDVATLKVIAARTNR